MAENKPRKYQPKRGKFWKAEKQSYNMIAYIILIIEDASSITTTAYAWPTTTCYREQ